MHQSNPSFWPWISRVRLCIFCNTHRYRSILLFCGYCAGHPVGWESTTGHFASNEWLMCILIIFCYWISFVSYTKWHITLSQRACAFRRFSANTYLGFSISQTTEKRRKNTVHFCYYSCRCCCFPLKICVQCPLKCIDCSTHTHTHNSIKKQFSYCRDIECPSLAAPPSVGFHFPRLRFIGSPFLYEKERRQQAKFP